MRRQKWGIAMMAAALCLTGCGSSVDLNEKQNAEAAEYIAGVLLKHSSNYDKSLIYPEATVEPENTSSPQATETAKKSEKDSETAGGSTKNSNKETVQENASIEDVFSVSGFQFKCCSKKECREYTQKNNKGYAIYAESGKKLVVVNFKIKNTSSSDKKLNLLKKGIKYQLITSDGKSYDAQITFLENDMNFLSEKIKAGKTKETVVLFMVPEKVKTGNCQLKISNGSASATVNIP